MDDVEIVSANIFRAVDAEKKTDDVLVFEITFRINNGNNYEQKFFTPLNEKVDVSFTPLRFYIFKERTFNFLNGRGGNINVQLSYFKRAYLPDAERNFFEIIYNTNDKNEPTETKWYVVDSANKDGSIDFHRVGLQS